MDKRTTNNGNNLPLAVLLIGLLAVIAVIVAYGVYKNNSSSLPGFTDTSDSAKSSLPSDTTEKTTDKTLEVLATTDTSVTQNTSASQSAMSTNDASTGTTQSQSKYSDVSFYKSKYQDRYESYGNKNPEFTAEQVVTFVNIGLDKKYFTDSKSSINKDTKYVLTNKYFYLDSDYVPSDLKKFGDKYIGAGNTGNKMVAEAVDAFEKMSDDAAELGLSILARSGYRSFGTQEAIYNNMVNMYSQEKADTFSARPGFSEHQTGYAVDVCTKTVPYGQFATTKEYQWAKDNIHKYGFVIHYTEDNEWITGYMAEAWHFRYIGVEAATAIYESGLSVEEYIIRYHDK